MPQRKPYIIPCLLFLFSLILRLSLISKGPFSVDCLMLAINAKETLATGQLHYQYGFGYPLTVLLGALFVFLTSPLPAFDHVLAVNLMSVVFSSLCVLANYLFVKKLFDETAALFSSLLLSVFPIFLGLSVFGTSHTPSMFFLLSGLWLLSIGLENNSKKYFIYAGISFGLMGAARFQDMVLMAIPVSYFYFWGMGRRNKNERPLRHYVLFLTSAVVAVATFHLPFFMGHGHHQFDNQLSEYIQMGLATNFRGLFSSSLLIGMKHIVSSLSLAGAFSALLGLCLLSKKMLRVGGFLGLWFIVPFLFYSNLWSTAPRFLLISSIPLIMAEGYLLSQLALIHKAFKGIVLAIFLTIFFVTFGNIYPIVEFRHRHNLLPEFSQWVSQNTEPDAQIISADDNQFIWYYGQRKILPRPYQIFYLDAFDQDALQNFKKKLDKMLEEKIPVYITDPGLYAYNPQHQFSNFMKENYDLRLLGKKFMDDWHQGETILWVGWAGLYKISKKQNSLP